MKVDKVKVDKVKVDKVKVEVITKGSPSSKGTITRTNPVIRIRYFAIYLLLAAISVPITLPGYGKSYQVDKGWYAVVVTAKPQSIGSYFLGMSSLPNLLGDSKVTKERNMLAYNASYAYLKSRGWYKMPSMLNPNSLRNSTGHSASLLLALVSIDNASSGSLLNGKKIGATGVLYNDNGWRVWKVGSLNAKISGARQSGLDILLVPEGSVYDKSLIGYKAFKVSGGVILEVSSLESAISLLCGLGSEDELCRAEAV